MAMRISGLMSGMDTETIISQLVEAKSTKLTKTKKAQKSLSLKQDAWKTLNTQIMSLYNKTLSNMRFESSFIKKTTKVSNSSVVSVITGEGAMNSVQNLEVNQLAKSAYLTGGKMMRTDGGKVTGDTKLSELAGFGGGSGSVKISGLDKNGEYSQVNFNITDDMTVNGFVSALKSQGIEVNANFDEAQGRIYISSKGSGAKNNFDISVAGGSSGSGEGALMALGLNYGNTQERARNALHTSMLNAAPGSVLKKISNDLDFKLNEAGLGSVSSISSYSALSAEDKAKYNKALDEVIAEQLNGNSLTDAEKEQLRSLSATRNGAIKTEGSDATITLNGATYTSDTNTFAINGLTLTVNATTAPGESVTVTTEDDTEGIYDMIKNFFKEYNALINQMDKLYNADSAKEYEPLLSDEKEAMSDSEVEEWETKVKDAILRKDETLGSFSSAMKEIMMGGVEVNGKKMYLSNFGINTLSYFIAAENEKNAYHIDGDSDDSETSGNADVLKSMIANDPDTVVSFFTQLSQTLYNKMTELVGTSEYSSMYYAYDDKKMQTEYDNYTTKIKELEDKLADYEDKWYAKFAAMETALSKMQQNASAVTALLGGSSY